MLCCLFLFAIAGCDPVSLAPSEQPVAVEQVPDPSGESPSPGGVAQEPTEDWQREEIAYDYAAMQEDVRIQLNEESRLQSPLRTVVGIDPQSYTFFFREAVNRGSVEEAIRTHAKAAASKEIPGVVEPAFRFYWVHDRQLQVLVTLPQPFSEAIDWQEYVLNAGGAKTATGHLIGDSFAFQGVVLPPHQIWRISVDGKARERLTDFSVMKNMEFLDADAESRYILLSRFTNYCECDAFYEKLYSVYDLKSHTAVPYPVELTDKYRGVGEFMADRRGFFYALPKKGTEVLTSEFAMKISVDGYVHGASFSHDYKQLLMAVGKADQKQDLDLAVFDVDAGTEKRFPGIIKGWVPTSEWDGEVVPVSFEDDGAFVTFAMRKAEQSLEEVRQRFEWKSGKVTSWSPPVPADHWSGFIPSDDGVYHYYWNAGLYQGATQLLQPSGEGKWIPGTHHFLFAEAAKDGEGMELFWFDADRKQKKLLVSGLSYGFSLLGASKDGQWLYVSTDRPLAP